MKGKLVVFDGIDGCGSETQANRLMQYLAEKNVPARILHYPDYPSPVGKLIKEYLYSEREFPPDLQFMLHATDRIKDIPKIRRMLEDGHTVICNRYYTSILGYQHAQGFSLETALKIADIFGVPKPDVIIFLKISPETSIKRKNNEKSGNIDRNEKNMELLVKVNAMYEKLAEGSVFGPWHVIDGEKPIEEVFEQVKKILDV